MATAEALMARALELAARGRYTTRPNPRVGCVLVKDGEVVGEGFHQLTGGPHAEVIALKAAGNKARDADVYVSLEPCCVQGLTPPCTRALLDAGVARVFAAMEDPNHRVSGKGFAELRAAGIEVSVGLLQEQAQALNRGFISRMTQSRPWVTLKLGMSLDGRTALATGQSRWITGPDARADVHRLRAEAGSVMTSVNTVLADDPSLTVRTPLSLEGEGSGVRVPSRQPDRIVVDSQLRSSVDAKVWNPGARRIALCARPGEGRVEALRAKGVEVVPPEANAKRRVDLTVGLAALARLEISEVLVECGPILAGELLQGKFVDELVVYVAPSLIGHEGRALAQLPGIESLDQQLKWQYVGVKQLGPDLRLTLQRPVEA